MKKTKIDHYTDKEALDFHSHKKPGKIEISSSKNMTTKRDLALAYSPGVAAPVKMISKNTEAAYDYTSKGNLVAVISNGSAILGMGNLGALASKPVMEGKAVLFKRFADIDSIDLEIDSLDTEEIINSIKNFSPSFGGINLEDIAAPACFVIEQKLKKILDIPVFHDDQHGTAIITTAALINALDISGKSIKNIKVVVNGGGASALVCTELFKNCGVPNKNIIMLDRKGVIYKGRTEGMNQWKLKHATNSKLRTLQFKLQPPIKLSPKENQLLKMLLGYVNDLMPRELALIKIWNDDNYFTSRSMDVYIAKIRKYLSKEDSIEIENIHGECFRLIIND